ncbi:spoIIIJ-associated protein [Actinopolymorpha rutila]|uniref:SpoIIIJ-associated protein n=1 Tax=Actinopolymorpha rutila TaxID=446787 RepID=A0A852Z3E8_9ACTN|nr:spoIIIJ-associated protein [Actinopolymorpha rutila]
MTEGATSFVEGGDAEKPGGSSEQTDQAAVTGSPQSSESGGSTEGADEVSESEKSEETGRPDNGQESGEASADRIARLEGEGDVAADYLEELLDIADIDGDIDLDVEGDRAMVAIVGGDLNLLVGQDGEVLEALQELTRLAVYRETGERSRLMLDVGGYRAQRRTDLVALAEKVVEEVRASGEPVRMAPMTPFERKIVHDAVAAKGLTSESEGEEPDRRVVVQQA